MRDTEVGYCQGLSFVIATLLIQVKKNKENVFSSLSLLLLKIPEEQAFVLLCRLMEDRRYSLRELYKTHFENLQLKFYQLTRLIDELLPELSQHFSDLNIQSHMFASQWFLTLFTAKFPLYLVFRIIDLFLFDVRRILSIFGFLIDFHSFFRVSTRSLPSLSPFSKSVE